MLWVIRILSLSRIVHCSFGDENVILNVTFEGNSFWPRLAFLQSYPGLISAVEVIGKPIPLRYFEYGVGVKLRYWPSFARWLRMGTGPWNEDCLCTTLMCLQAAGIPVPYDIATPVGLQRWLLRSGYGRRIELPRSRRRKRRKPA